MLPIIISPLCVALTPFPLIIVNVSISCSIISCFFASSTIAFATGCSDWFSTLAIICSSSFLSMFIGIRFVSSGFPFVIVPVLSNTIVFTSFSVCIASPRLISIPLFAPIPVLTISVVGVASPRAQGHAITNTAIPANSASDSVVASTFIQGMNAKFCAMLLIMSGSISHDIIVIAVSPSTIGTNMLVILSAYSCIGIFGLFVLGLGVYIFLDKKKDEIELIKKK